jgi:pimeloyl-ACP methyl ester carboxylesterase
VTPGDVERVPYDEFAYFHENAQEYGIPYAEPPVVRRELVEVEPGRRLSALVWGSGEPELVLLHGGAQNAHTWDTVALALARPLVAIDLPGHGHSDGGIRGSLSARDNADDVAIVMRALAPEGRGVVGMSLGGMTALALAAQHPDLVAALVLVDITPGVTPEKASAITAFVNGPESFDSFDDLLARTIEFNPTRTESSLRRGILHNAVQRDDGSWVWRYARFRGEERASEPVQHPDFDDLWNVVSNLTIPVMLARGMLAQSVVDDSDEAELRRRAPHARVVHFHHAGHSIQGDMPVELAAAIDDFVP